MKVVFASDSFKGTMTQQEIIEILTEAAKTIPDVECVGVPVADGGEGTVDTVVGALGGSYRTVTVHGPLMEPVEAKYGLLPGNKAIIEMAAASGLTLLPEEQRNPLYTTSFGFGELIADALLQGCRDITVALGGSATNDGGMGALNALGWAFQDVYSNYLRPRGEELYNVARILYVDTANLYVNGWTDIPSDFNLRKALVETNFTIMCDVDNPLLGARGATYTFGPQKGADVSDLMLLEDGMTHFAEICKGYLGSDYSALPGAGAAGGLGFAVAGFLGGEMKSGIQAVLELEHFSEKLEGAAFCITGEGRLDEQSVHGKVISGVIEACKAKDVPLIAIVGMKGEGWEAALDAGIKEVISTDVLGKDPEDAFQNGKKYYIQTVKDFFRQRLLEATTPTKVIEGWFTVYNNAKELALGKKALIVTGAHSAEETGAIDDVTRALEKENVDYVRFAKIEENPSIETVMEATAFGLENQADFVIAIGGGSPLDAAKAIALMMAHPDQPADFLYEAGNDTALPLVAIPTTCGTGSEVNGIAVLTIHAKKTKGSMSHRVFPTVALLDPQYLFHAPTKVLNNTAVDALCHLYESFINTNADDVSKALVKQGITYWVKAKDMLDGTRDATVEDFHSLLLASMWAGNALTRTGTSLPHGLSYYLTYHLGIPHGQACGIFLANYLRQAKAADVTELLQATGFKDLDDLATFVANTAGIPDLTEADLTAAVESISSNPKKLANAPFYVDEEVLHTIAKQ